MIEREKKLRIIARGEVSDHCHVIIGGNIFVNEGGKLVIESRGDAFIKHLKESDWLSGKETWTKEHEDIQLEEGVYFYVPQREYDPFEKIIRRAKD